MTGIPFFEDFESELREQYGEPNKHIVTVSGLTGTGTSTVATFLAEEFDLERVNAGSFFRNLAKEFDLSLQEFDERTQELETEHDRDFDLEWDKTALKKAFTDDNFLLEGRLAGVLLKDIAPIRIKVTCDPDVIAKRVHGREKLPIEEAKKYIEVRNREVLRRYQEKYGINPRNAEHYNLVIDNSENFDAVKHELVQRIKELDVL